MKKKQMLKRADGSSSPRGLYDNLRKKAAENKRKGVKGKKHDEKLLASERKVKASEPAKAKNGISCWKGYEKKGTKVLKGRTVNNCVKK
jgi:hypothetical protein